MYREVEHRCVDCGAPLVPVRVEATACERCPHCGGIWMDTVAFLGLLRATPTAQHLDELLVHNDGSPRRKCPHCGEPMDVAWIDFLELDQCAAHGVWLDAGELEQALRSGEASPELKELLESIDSDWSRRARLGRR